MTDLIQYIIIFLIVAVYFLPSVAGMAKKNAVAIFAFNLLLGWTGICWVVALVWGLTKD